MGALQRKEQIVSNTISTKHLNETITIQTSTLKLFIQQYWRATKFEHISYIGFIVSLGIGGVTNLFNKELDVWRYILATIAFVVLIGTIIYYYSNYKKWKTDNSCNNVDTVFEQIYKQRLNKRSKK